MVKERILVRRSKGGQGDRRAGRAGGTRLGSAKGQQHRHHSSHQNQHQGGNGHLRLFGNEKDALLHGAFLFRHGGGSTQQARQVPTWDDHVHQGPAVVEPLIFTQTLDSAVVAGQFTVPAAEYCGPPYQGIEPVHSQAQSPQQCPQVVSMAVVSLFMGQDVIQASGDQSLPVDVNGRADRAKQAGGGQVFHQIYRHTAGRRKGFLGDQLPFLAQCIGEAEVGAQQDAAHESNSAVPGPAPERHVPEAGIFAVCDDLPTALQIHMVAADEVTLVQDILVQLLLRGSQGILSGFCIAIIEIVERRKEGGETLHGRGAAFCLRRNRAGGFLGGGISATLQTG